MAIVTLKPYIQDIKKLRSHIQLHTAQEKYTKPKETEGLFMFRHHGTDMDSRPRPRWLIQDIRQLLVSKN